ncbi:hypothetical protein EPR50_G00101680 [Perca flavescens]|uniref:Uncharacterized protein n=1 Tax=Perca flavescens TaxID=8167 RepID=A0A484D260_PERFV|nr:hypothetical protein EPR50_G00101680 [Perca flavescens]
MTVWLLFSLLELSHPVSCAAVPHGDPRRCGGRRATDFLSPPTGVPCCRARPHLHSSGKVRPVERQRDLKASEERSTFSSSHRINLDTLIRKGIRHEGVRWLVVLRLCNRGGHSWKIWIKDEIDDSEKKRPSGSS